MTRHGELYDQMSCVNCAVMPYRNGLFMQELRLNFVLISLIKYLVAGMSIERGVSRLPLIRPPELHCKKLLGLPPHYFTRETPRTNSMQEVSYGLRLSNVLFRAGATSVGDDGWSLEWIKGWVSKISQPRSTSLVMTSSVVRREQHCLLIPSVRYMDTLAPKRTVGASYLGRTTSPTSL